MHKNTFSATSDVKKSLLSGLDSGGLEMHKNTFLTTIQTITTSDVKK
jgi:hypothetical protein